MPTDPQHFKKKVGDEFQTTITATIMFKLTFITFLNVFNFIACLFLVFIIDFIVFVSFTSIFNKKKINEK